jgi:hypothetical protein
MSGKPGRSKNAPFFGLGLYEKTMTLIGFSPTTERVSIAIVDNYEHWQEETYCGLIPH